jgi:hypothetical protein
MLVHFINLNNFLEKQDFLNICLESWKKYMPDAEIKIWTEKDEFIQKTLNKDSKFLKYFLSQKYIEWCFLCDYLRLHLQYEFGGIYSELDQMILKPIKLNEDIEFCQSTLYFKSITTTIQPCYFKKGNKILKYLIDELDNNFDEYWVHPIDNNGTKFPFYGFSEWSICALRRLNNLSVNFFELKEKTKKFIKENGNWCIHLCDWQLKNYNKLVLIDYSQIKDFYIEKNFYLYVIFCKNIYINDKKFYGKLIDLEQKDLYLKFLKYKIFKEPDIKNRIIDVNNYLGDLDNLSEKDFEISINDI